MTLPREMVVPSMQAEYRDFEALLRSLSVQEWETGSRCRGWRSADVAAHVVGQLSDVVNFRLEGLGTPEVTERQVDERRGRTPAELADELDGSLKVAADLVTAFDDDAWAAAAPDGVTGTLGFGIEALWFDTFLHADDIRAAIGRPSQRGEGMVASLSHIAQVLTDQEYPSAVLALKDCPEFAVSGGGGQKIEGDAFSFVLASTGRGNPGDFGLDETVNIYR